MTLRDKYPQLRDPALLQKLVTRAVYATMALEAQAVPLPRVAEIVADVARERGLIPPPSTAATAA